VIKLSVLIDFYEELHLKPLADLEDIQKELLQLERTWKQREITNPEKATKMLALVIEANEVFRTKESRKNYDDMLKNKDEPIVNNADEEREQLKDKWLKEAWGHWDNKQYDLAQAAVQKAVGYYDENMKGGGNLFSSACGICSRNGDYQQALNYINQAIMIEPENLDYYMRKASIFSEQCFKALKQNNYTAHTAELAEKERIVYQTIINKAKNAGDTSKQLEAADWLSASYCYFPPQDDSKAKYYVNQVIALLKEELEEDWETTFNLREAKRVLDVIKEDEREAERMKTGDVARYEAGEVVRSSETYGGQGGCYIATTVYGSYDCPQVWVLRRYRDNVLANTRYGRMFIDFYYTLSPLAVKLFGQEKWFNVFWKNILDKKIAELKYEGFSDEPYDDNILK